MMDKKKDLRIGRRTFVKVLGTAAVALPFMGFLKMPVLPRKFLPMIPWRKALSMLKTHPKLTQVSVVAMTVFVTTACNILVIPMLNMVRAISLVAN